ncbi:autotransporter outer membrane beta-barrel domain-containing protein [Oceanicoccus sagamiensis]|uniref:Autotransporter domain-containing protein n=1 Tax=Oceanicoccus sagamiensis TaxID=716816 RepID=A0A1X9NAY4_9GAMM|nr:autotransporter domain-containing SGNH/GDSL hydrolase family protein [Oceanicoccus sagamiensis]ARN74776.1 hypothetical protein BST96_11990 [Oceanicoccus sagamiensis]
MLKKTLALSIAASLMSLSVSAQSNFTELVVFGDSLMDTGNYGNGLRFTNETAPGVYAPIAPDFLAAGLGLELVPAVEGGSNYGVGGFQTAQILDSVSGAGLQPSAEFPIAGSRDAYLSNVNGQISSSTLILIDGGGNDLRRILFGDPDEAVAEIGISAANYIQAIGDLADAGAKYIMVANVPDLANTPAVQAIEANAPALGAAAGATQVTEGYNGGVETLAALQLPDVNIIPVDIAGFIDYVFENADTYGFANGDLTVGTVTLDQRSMCYDSSGGGCIEHPTFGISGTAPDPRALVFNDTLHPTEKTSELFGDYLNNIIAAPQTIGLLPELALTAGRTQSAVSADELRRSRWGKAEGRLFVAGEMATDEYDNGDSPETENTSITVGRTFVASDSLVYGLALTLAEQELDIDGADIESESWGLSGMFGYRQDRLFVDTTVALSVLSYDGIKREFSLGVNNLTAEGDTDGHAWTVDSLAGYDLLGSDSWHLAPAIGVQYINTTVDSYTESGGELSNYAWGEQRRKSLVWRYGVVGSGQLTDSIRVFAEVFGAEEQEDETESISARNTNLNFQSYKLPSFQAQDDSYISAAVGGSVNVFNEASLNLSVNYSDRGDGYEQIIFSYSMPM